MPNPEIDALYITFSTYYEITYDFPYSNKPADFIQLHKLLKVARERVKQRWESACENYFMSELGCHTLADFVVRFAIFQRSAIDRYNRPIAVQQARESENERRLRETNERWQRESSSPSRAVDYPQSNGLRVVNSKR